MIGKIVGTITPTPKQRLVEIGPGTGALTRFLYPKYPEMCAIEVDQRAIAVLQEEMPALDIRQSDVLKVNWSDLAQTAPLYVIGNLPYYITSPILFALLEASSAVEEGVFMMQKEVAERLVAKTRTKAYGILSVQFQYFTQVDYLFSVPPTVFSPPPKVDSAIVRIRFNKSIDQKVAYQDFKKIVRMAFGQRRKKLSNNLKPLMKDWGIHELPFSDNTRAEELTPEQFAELTHYLLKSAKA